MRKVKKVGKLLVFPEIRGSFTIDLKTVRVKYHLCKLLLQQFFFGAKLILSKKWNNQLFYFYVVRVLSTNNA